MSSDIVLSEFDLQMQPSLASIATSLEIQNDGEFGHTVVVADGSGRIVAATALIGSGETGELPVDLAPGRYEFTCRIVFQSEDGSSRRSIGRRTGSHHQPDPHISAHLSGQRGHAEGGWHAW